MPKMKGKVLGKSHRLEITEDQRNRLREYQQNTTTGGGYESIYDATLAAAKTKKLEVVENDKTNGRLILSHGVTLWSWGERIAVFVKPMATNSTEVEIVSKPVLSPLNFPPDWQQILLDQIDIELRSRK